jgi:hypothetical protein
MRKRKTGIFTCFWWILLIFCIALNVAAWSSTAFCDWYVATIFPLWPASLGKLTSRVPFSVGERLLAVALIWLAALIVVSILWLIRRALAGHRGADLPYLRYSGFAKGYWAATLWIAAVVFLIMTLNCILMYHVTPLETALPGYGKTYSLEDLTALREFVVDRANTLAAELPRDADGNILYGRYRDAPATADADRKVTSHMGSGVPVSLFTENTQADMADGARSAMEHLSEDPLYRRLSGFQVSPKPLSASGYVSQQYMQGYYFPFSMEANYNELMEEMNKPFTMCHELSHTHGYIYEDDANFLGWLACIRSGDPVFEYSGWLGILNYVNNSYYRSVSRKEYDAATQISDQVWRDETFVSRDVWDLIEEKSALRTEDVKKSADTYLDVTLKANGVSEGKAQYDHVVALLLSYYDGDFTK